MALVHSFEKTGNWLFKYRGQIPILLFILAIPATYFIDYLHLKKIYINAYNLISCIMCIAGLGIRAWAVGTTPSGTSGRNTQQQIADTINTTGIYSTVRHPLYLGNYLSWAGIVLYTYNFSFFIIVSLLFWIYYERIMFAEERFLEKKFGEAYVNWSLKTPAFVPSFKNYVPSTVPFSWVTVLRREYSGWLAAGIGFAYENVLRNWITYKKIAISPTFMVIVPLLAVVALILRTLKRRTTLLHEAGRS